jgi:hypothetical protein
VGAGAAGTRRRAFGESSHFTGGCTVVCAPAATGTSALAAKEIKASRFMVASLFHESPQAGHLRVF